jgi:shikimate 5-dehydrogenase
MYFIGVSTAQSAINRIFPVWTRLTGCPDSALAGIDLPVDSAAESYRATIRRIRDEPCARGALVTTHKVQIYRHAADLFTSFDTDAKALGEVSCIVRREGRLTGIAVDTCAAGLAFESIGGFQGKHVLIIGAGGAGLALAVYLNRTYPEVHVTLTDISEDRILYVQNVAAQTACVVKGAADLFKILPPSSLIVNATGMGKDRPGCPISEHARFPDECIAWDFNYRGNLKFLDYARQQGVRAVDGWDYFLHGWTQIMSRVFGFPLTPALFDVMAKAAADLR